MSQDKLDHQQDPKAFSRRSRKDQQGRDYVCGCGKRYLSYPALYTHIKTKHHGQQPQGTQKTGMPPIIKKSKYSNDGKVLAKIQNLVHIQNLNILNYLDQNARGFILIGNRIRKQYLPKQMLDTFNLMIKLTCPLLFDKKSTLQTILVCYLVGVGQYCSQAMFYQYYCPFAKYFRTCFHYYMQQIYENCFKQQDKLKNIPIKTQQCLLAPIICDFFLRFYLPSQKKQQQFITVMQMLSYDFCNWMFQQKLTIVEISLKKQYKIRSNLIQPKKGSQKIFFNQVSMHNENQNYNGNYNGNQNQNQNLNQNQNYNQNQNLNLNQNYNYNQNQNQSQFDNDGEKLIDQQKVENQIQSQQNRRSINQLQSDKEDIKQGKQKAQKMQEQIQKQQQIIQNQSIPKQIQEIQYKQQNQEKQIENKQKQISLQNVLEENQILKIIEEKENQEQQNIQNLREIKQDDQI